MQLKWLDVQEGHTFRHLPEKKVDKDQDPSEMELIAMILGFAVL
jgi:hypothetical protein